MATMEFQQANAHVNHAKDGAYWMHSFQASAAPNPVRNREKNYRLKAVFSAQNSALNSRYYTPNNTNLQSQQGPCNQPTQHTANAHYGSASYGAQYHRVQEAFYQNLHGSPAKPHPTATSPSHRQYVTHQSFSPHLPSYNGSMSQSFTKKSLPYHQISCNSSQRYWNQHNYAPHHGGDANYSANYSVNSNSYSCRYGVQKDTYTQPLKATTDPHQNQYGHQAETAIAIIANDMYKSYPTDSQGRQQVHTKPYIPSEFAGGYKVMSNQQHTTSQYARHSTNSNPTTYLQFTPNEYKMTQHTKTAVPQNISIPSVTKTTDEGLDTTKKANHLESHAAQSTQLPAAGCASARAVAVVQPLSQEILKQVDGCAATDKSSIRSENAISPAVAKKAERSNGFDTHLQNSNIQRSAASNDGPQDTSREQELAEEQCIPSVPQMLPEMQNCEKDKGETSADPKACVTDLSSVQTTPWTAAKLATLIQDLGKAQVKTQDSHVTSLTDEMKTRFWKQKEEPYRISGMQSVIPRVSSFCEEHVTSDTVVLSQVEENLQNYHVLKDDDVCSEPPYISSWLNVNEQVDDIDKEFGFSLPLDYRLQARSQKELVPADPGEENQDSTVKSTSTCPDDSSDPYYSIEIKVLTPEEAKRVFEQIQESVQSMDTDSQPEREDQRPNNEEVTGSDSEHGRKEVSSIETFCCLEWWMEKIIGPGSTVKCNCKKKLSGTHLTEKNPDEEETMIENDSKLRVIELDRKGDAQEEAEENGCDQKTTWSCSASADNLGVELTGDDDRPRSPSENSEDDRLIIRESEDEDLCSSQSDIPSLIPDPGTLISDPKEVRVQEPLESADVDLERNSDRCNQEFKKVFSGDPVSQMSDPEEACGKAPPTQSAHVAESTSDNNTAQSQRSTACDLSMPFRLCDEAVGKKRKKIRSHKQVKKSKMSRDSEPVLKHPCERVSEDAADEPSRSNVKKSAELMLFGSKRHSENISYGGRTCDVSPPRTLSVNLDKPGVTAPEYSARQMVHDAWRRSYLPILLNLRLKAKLKMLASYPESEHNAKDSSKRKHSLSLKERLSEKVKLVNENMTETQPLKLKLKLKQPGRPRRGDRTQQEKGSHK